MSHLVGSLVFTLMVILLSTSNVALAETKFTASDQEDQIDSNTSAMGVPPAGYSFGSLRGYNRNVDICPTGMIVYGKPMDRDPGDSSGQWEFTMGSMF